MKIFNIRIISTTIIMLIYSFLAKGQTISGTTFYKMSNEPFPLVNILLLDSINSNILSTTKSDFDGNFKFEHIKNGHYNLKTTDVAYGDSTIPIIVNGDIKIKIIILKENCIYNKSINNKICPKCHRKDKTIPIIYGLIIGHEKKNSKKKRYYIGGCQITDCDPNWFCIRDNFKF